MGGCVMDWAIWLSALFAGVGLVGAAVSYHTRLTFGALRERVGRLEDLLDGLPDKYARRDDVTRGMDEMKGALTEIFAELRRANEGIAALASRGPRRRDAGAGGEKGTE